MVLPRIRWSVSGTKKTLISPMKSLVGVFEEGRNRTPCSVPIPGPLSVPELEKFFTAKSFENN